jgi:hypothetical protein
MKQLSSFYFDPSRKYRAVLACDLVIDLGAGFRGHHEFQHQETLWGVLDDDRLTIFAGYASDLCSPGFYFCGRWFGTPSKGAELAAFLHDFLRQFMAPNLACSPWDRAETDRLFYNAMTMLGFRGRDIYNGAVAGPLGSLWIWLNKPRPDVYCRVKHKPTR